MEAKNKKVLEALQMQPLSDEEKASRHILARLYGPIATTKEKTRNGRGYNKDLWEKALADEIFQEKIANKSLFLELGHPLDREETDMEKVCACIPEMPKIVDGDLYAYVDILDTKNGRLLKTLCDYGFVPGISSRGSGDIMANDEVDPETFFLETWDIVQLPAVKKARLAMCESLGSKTLSKALRESLEKASEEEKKELLEALDQLNIKLTEEVTVDTSEVPVVPAMDGGDEDADLLMEADEEIEEPIEEVEEEQVEAEEEIPEEKEDEVETEEEVEVATVKTFIDMLGDYEEDLEVEFKPIVIGEKEYEVTGMEFDDEEGKVVVSIGYNLPEEVEEEDNKEEAEVEETEADVEEVSSEEEPVSEEEVEESEEAVDDGDEEVFESLKEMVRQKDLLENEIRDLKNQKTVSDAEVKGLKEELEKYKSGFIRVSELASKSTKLDKEVKSLKEQLESRDSKINDLQTKIEKQTRLTESVKADDSKVKALTEKLVAVQTEAENTEEAFRTKLEESRKAVQKNANVAKAYKSKYEAVLERYISTKANMLGVRTTDITSRLAESYTLDDIDQVCEDLLDMGRPAFGLGLGKPKVKINESKVNTKKPADPNNGYEIDDDLLILAGLK